MPFNIKPCTCYNSNPTLISFGIAKQVINNDGTKENPYFVDDTLYYVTCQNCDRETDGYRSIQDAVDAWNNS